MGCTLNLRPIPATTCFVPDPAPLGTCLVSWPILTEETAGTEETEFSLPWGRVLDELEALPDIASL